MFRNLFLVLSIFIFLSSPSNAVTVYGGKASCGTILAEAENYDTGAVHMTWSMGWITGINMALQVTWNNAPDPRGIWQAILLHCENNPLDTNRDAVIAVYQQIMDKQ